MSNNTKLLCLFLRAQKINKSSEQGYAMAMVSMVSIIMLSLLAASMTFSNLSKSRTDAFVDSSSAFSVAEAGLNKRGSEFKAKLVTYSGVLGVSNQDVVSTCFSVGIPANASASDRTTTDDFECRNYRFKSSNNAALVGSDGNISLDAGNDVGSRNTYVAYTKIRGGTSPKPIVIPTNDPFDGLNALEYKYELHSTAKKPTGLEDVSNLPNYTADQVAAENRRQNSTPIAGDEALIAAFNIEKSRAAGAATEVTQSTADKSNSNIDLSLTFTNRVVPLFQFGIFYNGDIEFNSTSPMSVDGRVHSNANIYVQPAGVTGTTNAVTTFLKKVSAAGSLYNRIDAWADGVDRVGIVRVLLTGSDCLTASNCLDVPTKSATATPSPFNPLTVAHINTFGKQLTDGVAGAIELKTPSPGFTRKRNYFDNKIGEYYAKADMRLDFVPDRDVDSGTIAAATATRDQKIIPFNFTSINTRTTGTTCTTALTAGSDPAADYIPTDRESFSTRRCNKFTKGQLQSLRQPVLVLTKLNQTTALAGSEGDTLGIPKSAGVVTLPTPPDLTPITVTPAADAVTDAQKNQILRALQVALVSTPSPISLDRFNTSFSLMTSASELEFRDAFNELILNIFPISTGNINTNNVNQGHITKLLGASPNQIAALREAWFLPAPIQRVETATVDTANNPRSSGFYDGREKRWISVLQTNIASLSVWNRDGVYVPASNETMTSAYAPSPDSSKNRASVFSSINTTDTTYSTDGLAFDRATPANIAAAVPAITAKGLQTLGLGSIDSTEGGLVFHASVNDDLNGDNVMNANDVTKDTTNPVLKKNPDNTNYIDPITGTVTIDYLRKYPGNSNTKQSPFAFAFNGGKYLQNSLMLSSDQAVYIQGDFNNNDAISTNSANVSSPNRLPAAVVADTITVLSNECMNLVNPTAGVPAGQLNCGLKGSYALVANPTTINAAFLANTDISSGNQGANRGSGGTLRFSGGVNNYIRLLEDWGNFYALNYMGSLVSLGSSLEYSGRYQPGGLAAVPPTSTDPDECSPDECSYYNIPLRSFNYDTKFNTVSQMPPLTPRASYIQQKNFGRTY
jgi:Tfp pilus assembly protein PilX